MFRILLCALLSLALTVPALAATKNGVTPLAPANGKAITAGEPPTFKVRAKGGGSVWLHVCKSRKKAKDGTICNKVHIQQMERKGGVYRAKPADYTFGSYWVNTPGTYFWQVHRIKCETRASDCRQEGPVQTLRIRG